MKRIGLWVVLAAACVVAAGACSKSHSSGGNGDLESGLYAISDPQTSDDGCAVLGNYPAGADLTVIRSTAEAVSVAGIGGTIDNGVINAQQTVEFDWSTAAVPFDCQETDTWGVIGQTTVPNAALLSLSQSRAYKSGTQCAAAYTSYSSAAGTTVSLPCHSSIAMDLSFFSLLPTPTPTPVAINGTLTTAFAFGAELTASNASLAGSIAASASLDVAINLPASATWICFSPAPPDEPGYDLIATDYSAATQRYSYFVKLTVSTASWATGAVALDGTSNTLYFEDIDQLENDRYVTASSGTAMLFAAPTAVDATTSQCSFGIKNLAVSGFLNPGPGATQ